MTKDILYTWAVDENDNPVHINDAEKGGTYFCLGCRSKFILRDSGKTGPGSRRKHFGHAPDAICSGESYMHNTFIKRVFVLLEEYRVEGMALEVNWTCKDCHTDYSNAKFNLLAKTARIETEYPLEGYRPDIALLDAEGKVIAAIEIVYTHEPEEGVLLYYKNHGITLVQINIFFEGDLDRVEERILKPNIVNLCLNHKCPNFSNHEAGRKMLFPETKCNRCGEPLRTCQVVANSVFGAIPAALTEKELREAAAKGVQFTIREKQLWFICPHCVPKKIKVRPIIKLPRSRGRRGPRL